MKPPFSYSNLSSYNSCPQRHHFERGLNIKPLDESPHPAALRGVELHRACEEYTLGTIDILPNELLRFRPILDKLKASGARAEVKYAVDKDCKPVPYDSPDAYFYGIIDTLELSAAIGCVGDWKSGKERDYSQQLKFYAMLVLANHPELAVCRSRIRYIDLGLSSSGAEYGRANVPTIFAEFNALAERAVNDHIRAPRPSDLCVWCPYSKRKMNICKW